MVFTRHDDRAADLQRSVKYAELEQLEKGLDDYSDQQLRQSVVHTRQDLVLVVSQLSALNTQIATIRRILWIGLGVLIAVAAGKL